MVGGELAHGTFEHGFETYGVDILRRLKTIADRYRGYLPCSLRGKGVDAPERTFQPLSIKAEANTCHGMSASGVPLWSTDAEVNLANLPYGSQEFQGVSFEVLDPTERPYRSCVVLSRQNPYPQGLAVPAGAKASSVYLLNAAEGADNEDGTASMLLTFHYADGSSDAQDVAGRGWSFPTDSKYDQAGPRTQDTYRVAWKRSTLDEKEFGVYVTGVENPHPEREIASLEMSVDGAGSKWLILGVTLSSAPVFFAPYDDLSSGIPDGWTGSVIYALIEGLAGIKDLGAAFSRTELIPRWDSANVPSAEIAVRYPASEGYCCSSTAPRSSSCKSSSPAARRSSTCRFFCRPVAAVNAPASTETQSPPRNAQSSSRTIWCCPLSHLASIASRSNLRMTMNRRSVLKSLGLALCASTAPAEDLFHPGVNVEAPQPKVTLNAEVRDRDGRPTILINGKPESPIIYALTDCPGGRWPWEELPAESMGNFVHQGFRLFQVDIWLSMMWAENGSLDLHLAAIRSMASCASTRRPPSFCASM